jgi:hypothetical protein
VIYSWAMADIGANKSATKTRKHELEFQVLVPLFRVFVLSWLPFSTKVCLG